MFKIFIRIFVEKIYKMGCLEGSGVPVLYIGRTVPKVNILYTEINIFHSLLTDWMDAGMPVHDLFIQYLMLHRFWKN